MLIDLKEFPLVYMRADQDSTESPEAQIKALFARGERFVMIADHSPEHHQEEPHEQRKQRAQVLKRFRDQLKRWCAGAIVIENGGPISKPIKLAAQAFGNAFGVSFAFVKDDDTARKIARRILVPQAFPLG
ncbi:hypothetical protein AB4Y96_11275 [Phyllobacterium sp. TAF24]|uniref:hypothetical protein n=1 Tax=unclassified Phyllobacterium TaxID=2638441 RepID=UPI00088C9CA8|nr:hypothetical protein [Phyllobacterium sp. OV277]SDO98835.1 hypothetical protein SAMN05443582_10390 [Phyllobacterium sp. OV277]